MHNKKHSFNIKFLNKKLLKFRKINILILFFLIGILSYSIKKPYFKTFSLQSSPNYESSKNIEKTTLDVENAEFLQITSFNVKNNNSGLYTVTVNFKNVSNQSYENINLRIRLFDENNNEITFLDYKIDKINANDETHTFAALRRDLSSYKKYSISLINT